MSSADAKKYLTGVEQHIRNKLLETVRAAPIRAPREYDFENENITTIAETDMDDYGESDCSISSAFRVLHIPTQEIKRMAELTNHGYSMQVRVESGMLSMIAIQKVFDEQKYKVAAATYDDLQSKKKVAEIELKHWNDVIAQRKKETLEPDLPNTVEELQALVRKLQSTK